MGFFDALGNLAGAAVKTGLTPIALAKDVAKIMMGEDPTATEEHIKSIGENLEKAGDELMP